MKKLIMFLFLPSLVLTLASCSSKTVDIKSPCVSKDNGPCGPRKPINDWWLKQNS